MTREQRDPIDATPSVDERAIDDPSRLADEARGQRENMAAELRSAPVPIETELPTTYRA